MRNITLVKMVNSNIQKQIILHDRQVDYTLRKSLRARRMRIAVYCDGSVVVTTPMFLTETAVERFLREKAQWLMAKIALFKQYEGRIVLRHSKADYVKHKADAYTLTRERVAHFNALYGFAVHAINIKNQKTRWGSCSRKGNLNFNYKIALLPQRLADYIVVHELCHLGEFNHSKKFWNLVARAMPNHAELRKELRKTGVVFY